jgi:murein DD-endopeptidase MepM/ murein hydrolase activator NlpD
MYGAVSSSTKAKLTNAVMGKGVVPPKPGEMLYPVPGVAINSPFGPRGGRNHNGVDMAADEGTPILAAMDGVISEKGLSGSLTSGYGYFIAVKHADGSVSETLYAHLRELPDIAVGTPVKAGQVIASMGTTGGSTGPHLHFEVRDANGQVIDPATVLPSP